MRQPTFIGKAGRSTNVASTGAAAAPCAFAPAMHVIEIFLPLKRSDGSAQPGGLFGALRRELIERFGGLTAFTRAPAEGLWEDQAGEVERDQIIIFEVVAETLDRPWWQQLRARLEREFQQDEVLIRAAPAERL
jgi:hypothetical protein